jgi:hypothetical protein
MAQAKATGKKNRVTKARKSAATKPKQPRSFNEFGIEEWRKFIEFALYENPSVLDLGPREETLDAGFIHIVNILGSDTAARNRFGEALTQVFESSPISQDNAEAIYTLLQLISYITPSAAKSIVRRKVFEESFRGLQFAAMDLHTLALAVAGEWEVDQDLASYITRFNEEPQEFRCRLLSLRLLSRKDPSDAYAFLPKIITELEPGVRATQLFRELRGIMLQRTFAGLLSWYRDNQVYLWNIPNYPIFYQILTEKLVPRQAINKATDDKYGRLFAYYVHGASLSPDEMNDLHKMRQGTSAEFDREVRKVLQHVHKQTDTEILDPMSPIMRLFVKPSMPKQDIVINGNGQINVNRNVDDPFLLALAKIDVKQAEMRYVN